MHYLFNTNIMEKDIYELVDKNLYEDYYVEFKSEISMEEKGKISFLKNVCAFANSYGGLLFYGIEQNKKENKLKLVGIDNEKIDDLKLTLKNLIRDSIRPSVKCEILHIPLSKLPGKSVIVVRVYPSYFKPHRVEFKKKREFYWRTTAGVDPMPFEEIRRMFIESASIYEKVEDFRRKRVEEIREALFSGNPLAMVPWRPSKGKGFVIVHLIPISAFYSNSMLNIREVGKELIDGKSGLLSTISGRYEGTRYNFKGILRYDDHGYVQLNRNGIIEALDSSVLARRPPKVNVHVSPKVSIIDPRLFVSRIVRTVSKYLELLKDLKLHYPIALFLSLINVKGYRLVGTEAFNLPYENFVINEPVLLIPGIIIEKEDDFEKRINDIFDPFFNACGHPGLEDYEKLLD